LGGEGLRLAGGGCQLHIVTVLAGIAGLTLVVVLAAWAAGLSGWTVFGLGAVTLLIGQGLYLAWVAGMAAAEARRRRQDEGAASDSAASRKGGAGKIAP
jgi:uncharacterized membrane protein